MDATSYSRVGSTRGTPKGWYDVQISVVEKMLQQELEQFKLMERARQNSKGSVSEAAFRKQKEVVTSLQAQYAQLSEQFDKRRTSVFRYSEDQQDALQQAIATGDISYLDKVATIAGSSPTSNRRNNRRSGLPNFSTKSLVATPSSKSSSSSSTSASASNINHINNNNNNNNSNNSILRESESLDDLDALDTLQPLPPVRRGSDHDVYGTSLGLKSHSMHNLSRRSSADAGVSKTPLAKKMSRPIIRSSSSKKSDSSDDSNSDDDEADTGKQKLARQLSSNDDFDHGVTDDPNELEETVYGRPSVVSAESQYDAEDEILTELVFEDGQVAAGTLDGLLAHLVPSPDIRPDSRYTIAFLFTYRVFISPSQLMERVSEHYMALLDAVIESDYMEGQVRTTRIMLLRYLILFRTWLQQFGRDFRDADVSDNMKRMIDATEMLFSAHTTPFNVLLESIAAINGAIRSASLSAPSSTGELPFATPTPAPAEPPRKSSSADVTPPLSASVSIDTSKASASPLLAKRLPTGNSSDSLMPLSDARNRSPSFSGRNLLVQQLKRKSNTSMSTPPSTPSMGRPDRASLASSNSLGSSSSQTSMHLPPALPPAVAAPAAPAPSLPAALPPPPLVTQPLFTKAEEKTIKDLVAEIRRSLSERHTQFSESHDASKVAEKMYQGKRRGSTPNLMLLTTPDSSFASFTILTISKSVEKIAKNLIWRDYHLFAAIQSEEYVMHLQRGSDVTAQSLLDNASNLNAYVTWFNTLSYWIATQVCIQEDAHARAKAIDKFIRIAKICLRYNSFNCLMAILSGLNNSSVQRLKKTWLAVKSKRKNEFFELEELMRPQSNFRVYRDIHEKQLRRNLEKLYKSKEAAKAIAKQQQQQQQATVTFSAGASSLETASRHLIIDGGADAGSGNSSFFFVPFFTLDIKDLYVMHDANPNVLSSGLVNFRKMRSIAERITNIVSFRRAPPPSTIEPDFVKLQQYLSALTYLSDKELYRISCEREPREGTSFGGSMLDLTAADDSLKKAISEPNLASLAKKEKGKK